MCLVVYIIKMPTVNFPLHLKKKKSSCIYNMHLKGYSTFFGNRLILQYNSPRVKQLSFTIFESIQLIF